MANNAIGGHLQGVASHNMAYGQLPAGGIGISPKGPVLERYHSGSGDDGWMKSKGGKKNNGIALSALTLLAFLFFLNILQNCLQDHMDEMKGKGKGGYYVQPTFNITIPVSRRSSEERAKSQKGETGEFPVPESDNSLEIDNFTGEEAHEVEQRLVPEHKYGAKRRMYSKKKSQATKKNIEKVNTLYNIND